MKVIAQTGNLPVLHSAELAPASGGGKDVYAAYEEVSSKGHLLPYLDYGTPTFSDTLGAALQDLIAGKQIRRSSLRRFRPTMALSPRR